MRRDQLSIRTRIALELHGHAFIFIYHLSNMEYSIPKITSDSQEAKEKVEEVLEQVEAIRRQLRLKTQGNLGIKASANEIQPLMNSGDIRFRRGCDIANQKNQIIKLDRSQYSVKSQSNCGEYEVISTELGWTCTCADHRFRNSICKHIFAIFSILKLEQEAGLQDSTELTHTYCDRSIVGEDHDESLEEAWTMNKPGEPIEVKQELLTDAVNQNLSSGYNAADYEQELYEKDRYIEGLENEIRGLMGPPTF